MDMHGTDKGFTHNFDAVYESHFECLRDLPIRILEIGIGGYQVPGAGGESLRMWAEYFHSANIYGIDVFSKTHVDSERIKTFKGNQEDKDFLEKVDRLVGPFDIVIDDGSHLQIGIRTAFQVFFPSLNPGGIYIIEDIATAYYPDFDGDYLPLRKIGSKPNTIALIAELIDGMQSDFWTGRSSNKLQKMVQSVHCERDIVFITKKPDVV